MSLSIDAGIELFGWPMRTYPTMTMRHAETAPTTRNPSDGVEFGSRILLRSTNLTLTARGRPRSSGPTSYVTSSPTRGRCRRLANAEMWTKAFEPVAFCTTKPNPRSSFQDSIRPCRRLVDDRGLTSFVELLQARLPIYAV